jgi:hypothetical protein
MTRPLHFLRGKPSCSNCGKKEGLHLVTCAGPGAEGPGRTLVYCPKCRVEHQHNLDVSFPLNLVTAEILLGLYASGKTTSDPRIVVESILGVADPDLAEQLESAMAP